MTHARQTSHETKLQAAQYMVYPGTAGFVPDCQARDNANESSDFTILIA